MAACCSKLPGQNSPLEEYPNMSRRAGKRRRPLRLDGSVLLLLAALCSVAPAQAQELRYSVSWMGNSFSGKDAWVLQDVDDLCVTPDGTVFTNVFWDEAGGNVQEYKDGALLQMARHTHGWGYEGGAGVAATSRYLFIVQNVDNEGGGLKGNSWPTKGTRWSGISRRLRRDIRQAAPFEGGHGKEGDVLQGAFLPVVTIPEGQSGALRGVCADEKQLYVSSPYDDSIKVYAVESMRPVRSWNVARPDKLCLDQQDRLWVLQRPTAAGDAAAHWRALCYSVEGALLRAHIDFPATMRPTALCVDRQNRLLVADAGEDQQIKIYANIDAFPKAATPFGVKGGLFAPPSGAFGPRRFNRPTGIGSDAAGHIVVASSGSTAGGSTVLECYAPDGALLWQRFGLTFVDIGDIDPNHPTEAYTKEEHFTLDPADTAGASWHYRGYTVNPYRYPDDPRLHTSPTTAWIRTLRGMKF